MAIGVGEEEVGARGEGVHRAGVHALGAERAPRNMHPDLFLLGEELATRHCVVFGL